MSRGAGVDASTPVSEREGAATTTPGLQPGEPTPAPAPPRVIGLDLSLTSTGVASNLGWADRLRPYMDGFARLRWLRDSVLTYVKGADLVVVEGLSVASKTGQHLTRAGLWHLIMVEVDERGIGMGWAEVAPTAAKKYATGRGNAGKDEVLAAVIKRFPTVDVRGNDEADALVLAAMGADALGHPMVEMPAAHRTALKSVAWPDGTWTDAQV